jgi:hypothetical protein
MTNIILGDRTIHGTLPGTGCTIHAIGIMMGEDRDWMEKDLVEEFRFRGGGNVTTNHLPPVVRRALEEWYEKLVSGRPVGSESDRLG